MSDTNSHHQIPCISAETDFWKDAQEFLSSQLPADFQDKMLEYAKTKNYSKNEFRLFSSMLKDAVGFHTTIVQKKHY